MAKKETAGSPWRISTCPGSAVNGRNCAANGTKRLGGATGEDFQRGEFVGADGGQSGHVTRLPIGGGNRNVLE